MNCDNATKPYRKSGVAEWRDLLFVLNVSTRVLNATGEVTVVTPPFNKTPPSL
jgi:hypothetical protein